MAYDRASAPAQSFAGFGARFVLTVLGAGGLIVGVFMNWTASLAGTDLSIKALWRTTFERSDRFIMTVGAAAVVLGLLAIIGMTFSTGWLTRLAGALGIVGVVLFGIQVYRGSGAHSLGSIESGAWVCLAGSVVSILAGVFGIRSATVGPAGAPAVER